MTTTATRSTPIGATDDTTAYTATLVNEGPGGCVGYGELDANTTGTITTENAIQVTSDPINEGRLIKISVGGTMVATGPTGTQFIIIEDSTVLLRREDSIHASSLSRSFGDFALSHSPSAGIHTYTLAYGISGPGGATVNIVCEPIGGDPATCYILIEDIGPDFS